MATLPASSALDVRPLSAAQHLAFVRQSQHASFLQCPSWGRMRAGWRPESIGWFDGDQLCGAGLVLYRDLPVLGSLAYLAEGPIVDWAGLGPERVTTPLLRFLRKRRVFTVRMTPALVLRRWHAQTLRAAVRSGQGRRLRDLTPDDVDDTAADVVHALRAQGWRQYEAPAAGFGGRMHPRYRSHIPITDRAQLLASLDTQWRRNLKRAERSGITVVTGDAGDLPPFHQVYAETAVRDRFPPLPVTYFQQLLHDLLAEDPDRVQLYLAVHEGQVHAGAVRTRVGDEVSYVYGASSNEGRPWRPSNALQWQMLSDAADEGAATYDLRGISDTLDPDDPLFGLLRFKLGLGADAVELVGEWDYPLRPLRHRAVTTYLDRRSR